MQEKGSDLGIWRLCKAQAELEALKLEDGEVKRQKMRDWAVGLGMPDWNPEGRTRYQAWQTKRLKAFREMVATAGGLAQAAPADGALPPTSSTSELADSPRRAPNAEKANHTPPGSQRSSAQQGSARRRMVVMEEDDDEEMDAEELAELAAQKLRDQQQSKEAWKARDAAAAEAEAAVDWNPLDFAGTAAEAAAVESMAGRNPGGVGVGMTLPLQLAVERAVEKVAAKAAAEAHAEVATVAQAVAEFEGWEHAWGMKEDSKHEDSKNEERMVHARADLAATLLYHAQLKQGVAPYDAAQVGRAALELDTPHPKPDPSLARPCQAASAHYQDVARAELRWPVTEYDGC